MSPPGSTVRIENGRRSGGSADRPALIITNWPGAAPRGDLGVPEGQEDVVASERLARDEGRDTVRGHGAMITVRVPGAKRDASVARVRPAAAMG